jgi:uncharacterized protein YraI
MSVKLTGRLLTAAAALALFAPLLVATASAQYYGENATPVVPLNLRAGPSDVAPVVGVMPPGMPVTEGITTPGGWTNVNTPEGSGWAYNDYLTPGY